MKAAKGSPLAQARIRAHLAFDALWQFDVMSRDEAYRRLANAMKLTGEACHIVKFDEQQCRVVVELVESGSLRDRSVTVAECRGHKS